MPRFSRRWGAPLSRQQLEQRPHYGRRPSNAASCLNRLEGWIRNVAARAPIWGDLHIDAFCKVTGYSREHTMRQLSKLRASCGDLAFETKMRCKHGRKRWGVIVAQRAKLRFDKRSLFYDHAGRPLHNYTTLGKGGEKIAATPRTHHSDMREQSKAMPDCCDDQIVLATKNKGLSDPSFKENRVCDIPYIGKDSFGIQRTDLNGDKRVMRRAQKKPQYTAPRKQHSLRRKAFAMMETLKLEHWDNCKVTFLRPAAFCYALNALQEGHADHRILRCYSKALFVSHGLATDIGGSLGKVVVFNPSSTICKARKMLASDGLDVRSRIRLWYKNHQLTRPSTDSHPAPHLHPIPSDALELRRKIAESLGCEPFP